LQIEQFGRGQIVAAEDDQDTAPEAQQGF
jgi:hypothetical protein